MATVTLSSIVTTFKRAGESRDDCEARILNAALARLNATTKYDAKRRKPKAAKAKAKAAKAKAKAAKAKAPKAAKAKAPKAAKVWVTSREDFAKMAPPMAS